MTHKWNALNPQEHKYLGFRAYTNYLFAKEDTFAPIVMQEIPHIVAYYPICFLKNKNSFELVAIQSLTKDLNIYITDTGKWIAPYIPSHYRSYPLRLLDDKEDPKKQVVCFDSSYEGIDSLDADTTLIPFFTQESEPSSTLKEVIGFLQKIHDNKIATQNLIHQLQSYNLIVPWKIEAKDAQQTIEGIYKIDEEALKELDPEALSALAKSSALEVAYTQLTSQVRLKDINRRYESYNQQKQKESQEIDVESFFNNDTISF